MKKIILSIIISISCPAWSTQYIHLDGQVTGFDKNEIFVKMGNNRFSVLKASLPINLYYDESSLIIHTVPLKAISKGIIKDRNEKHIKSSGFGSKKYKEQIR